MELDQCGGGGEVRESKNGFGVTRSKSPRRNRFSDRRSTHCLDRFATDGFMKLLTGLKLLSTTPSKRRAPSVVEAFEGGSVFGRSVLGFGHNFRHEIDVPVVSV